MKITTIGSKKKLNARLECLRQNSDLLRDRIDSLREIRATCCVFPSSSSSPAPSSSSLPSGSLSSSSSSHCTLPMENFFDEWVWNSGVETEGGLGVSAWEGSDGHVIVTMAERPDIRRARVQDGCILSNGAEGAKTAYQAVMPSSWYDHASAVPLRNALFFVVEIDLFKAGETVLWNHLMSGSLANTYNSFTSQTSTDSIGTRTNGIYFSAGRPYWMTAGVKRYIVEMRYGDDSSVTPNDFQVLVNGFPIVTTVSTAALKHVVGVGIVAPLDLAANSNLDRRLLSIFALQHPGGYSQRLSASSINAARDYLACKWQVDLQ